MTAQDDILVVENLGVAYGSLRALHEVSLRIAAGERVALLGHNGAGKSTLFKTVLGFLKPATGRILIGSCAPGTDGARNAVSYLPESVAFPKSLSGVEIITYFARLKGADPKQARSLLEKVGIEDAAHRPVGSYSKGMRQRLGLAQALIGTPQLLLLDEPTSGLDPISRRELYTIVDGVVAAGATVLHSSHSLSEVEGRTDSIVILSKGQLVAEGTLPELARQAQLPVTVRIRAHEGAAEEIRSRMGGDRINGSSIVLSCGASDKLAVLSKVAALGDSVADFDITMPSLDDVYKYFSDRALGSDQK